MEYPLHPTSPRLNHLHSRLCWGHTMGMCLWLVLILAGITSYRQLSGNIRSRSSLPCETRLSSCILIPIPPDLYQLDLSHLVA